MRVLFVAAEAAPYAKVGGLGDVASALPAELKRLGVDVSLVIPRHARMDAARHGFERLSVTCLVEGPDDERLRVGAWRGLRDGVTTYLVDEPRILARQEVYGYPDDLDRYAIFCRAALQIAALIGVEPDVVHANDWHTALLPAWLSLDFDVGGLHPNAASLLTLHNVAYQGWFDDSACLRLRLVPPEIIGASYAGTSLSSALALGIRFADLLTTVSPTYAQEIQRSELGSGLEELLQARADRLEGVLNGIDFTTFDPATDPAITPNYDLNSIDAKASVKVALQREVGLPSATDLPLVGVVGRLVEQKGYDLAVDALTVLLQERPIQVVVLGTGDVLLQRRLERLASQHQSSMALALRFDAELAQRIYAGADIFLMPSRFEPCGLGQLIAMRYGTIPVVRATGGLRDTVADWSPSAREGNGFVFQRATSEALLIALSRALEVYRDRSAWRRIQRNGMLQDHSWGVSALRYLQLYQRAIGLRRRGRDASSPDLA